jgi:RNA polymerase sigma-70 factor (ECF subfamily)
MAEADINLVQRTLDGDRSAFEALVGMHAARARAVARGVLGDDVAVDDVVQEAFMRAYNHLGQLGEFATFPAWLSTIVRNEAVSWLRRNARVRSVDSEILKEVAQQEGASENPLLDSLRRALDRLAPQYREILMLKYEASLDYVQIADSLGISVANVEKRLYRARQALVALLPNMVTPAENEKVVHEKTASTSEPTTAGQEPEPQV